MARRSFRGRRSSGRSFSSRSSRGRSRSFSRSGSRRRTSSRAGRSQRQQVVRIVLEQPGVNPVSRPGIPGMPGLAQDATPPRKARF